MAEHRENMFNFTDTKDNNLVRNLEEKFPMEIFRQALEYDSNQKVFFDFTKNTNIIEYLTILFSGKNQVYV